MLGFVPQPNLQIAKEELLSGITTVSPLSPFYDSPTAIVVRQIKLEPRQIIPSLV